MEGRTGPYPPDFLILGAQKCGTSSLAAALRSHPQVFMPPREGHHFDTVAPRRAGGRRYRRLFEGWADQPVVGEKTPEYLANPRCAALIRQTLPEVKGIAVLRNPVDRAYSAYWHGRRVGRVKGEFAYVIDAEATRTRAPSLHRSWEHLLQRGHYAEQLNRYVDLGFARERLLVLFYEEMIAQSRDTLVAVQQFLGVEVVITELPRVNTASQIRGPRLIRVVLTAQPLKSTRLARKLRVRLARPFTPPPMDPAVRARLVEYYRPHNARLAELLGRDLPDWDR